MNIKIILVCAMSVCAPAAATTEKELLKSCALLPIIIGSYYGTLYSCSKCIENAGLAYRQCANGGVADLNSGGSIFSRKEKSTLPSIKNDDNKQSLSKSITKTVLWASLTGGIAYFFYKMLKDADERKI